MQTKYHRSYDLYFISSSIRSRRDYPGLLLSFSGGIRIPWLIGLLVWGLAADLNTLRSDKWYGIGQRAQEKLLVVVVFTIH